MRGGDRQVLLKRHGYVSYINRKSTPQKGECSIVSIKLVEKILKRFTELEYG